MTVNEICKEKKKGMGYSASKVAELSGLPLSTVNNFFSSAAKAPSFDTGTKICKALQISVDALCEIITPGMDAHEINRIKEEHEKYKLEMGHTVDLYAQQTGYQDDLILAQKKTIEVLEQSRRTLRKAVWGLIIVSVLLLIYSLFVDFKCSSVGLIRY